MTCVWREREDLDLPVGAERRDHGVGTGDTRFEVDARHQRLAPIRREHRQIARLGGVGGRDVQHRGGGPDGHPRRTGDLDIDRLPRPDRCAADAGVEDPIGHHREEPSVAPRTEPAEHVDDDVDAGVGEDADSTAGADLGHDGIGRRRAGWEVHARRTRLRTTVGEDREVTGPFGVHGGDVQRHGEGRVGHVATGHLHADRTAGRHPRPRRQAERAGAGRPRLAGVEHPVRRDRLQRPDRVRRHA